jgi:hypothetical protein
MKQLLAFCEVNDTPEFFIDAFPYNVRDIEALPSPGTDLLAYRLWLGDVGIGLDGVINPNLALLTETLDADNLKRADAVLGVVPVSGSRFPAGHPCIDVVLHGTGGVRFAVIRI